MATIDLKAKRTELATLINTAKTQYAEMQQKGDAVTQEDRNKLDALVADGQKKRQELDTLETLAAMDEQANAPAPGEGQKAVQRADEPAEPLQARRSFKSWGRQVVESPQFKMNDGREMHPVPLRSNLQELKVVTNLFTTTQSISEPVLYDMDRQLGVLDIARQQPPSVIDLVNKVRTSAGAIEYVGMTARQNLAAVVPESSAGAGGSKPQGDLTFTLYTATVKTIAEWIAASRQILSDAPRLQDTINGELIYQVMRILEDQILNGDGTGNNFTGIYNWSGIQTRTMSLTAPVGRAQTTSDTKLDTLRRAVTDIWLAFYMPTGIVISPADGEALELAKSSQGAYLKEYDSVTGRLWRVPAVETPATAAGKALVGNFLMGATLWDREEANVRISENVASDFIQNMVRLLGEVRAAFAVVRPQAFEVVNLI
jgi:HK97 family phage major capsid protein